MNFFPLKNLALLALLVAVLAPSQACAEYKALLKSGEELYATNYWIDRVDNQVIRLEINGSMERMPRDQFLYIAPVTPGDRRVRTAIKRITFTPKDKSVATASRTEIANAADRATESVSQPQSQPPQNPQTDEKFLQSEAERIDREREAAKNDFKKALAGGDFSMRQRARQRILDLTEERSKLLQKVKVANSDVIPEWWRWKTED